MSKYRIYELAKDYTTTSKVIIDILSRNGVTAKNHMSSVDEAAKAIIERTFARKTGAETVPEDKGNFKNKVQQRPVEQTGGEREQAKQQRLGQTAQPLAPASAQTTDSRHDAKESVSAVNQVSMPERPNPQQPERPNPQQPQRPNMQQPQRPNMQQPQRPNMQQPQRPNMQQPQRPNMQQPQRPNPQQPQRPNMQQPQRPNMQQPQRPNMQQPQRPNMQQPQRPNMQQPQRPNMQQPQRPNAQGVGRPDAVNNQGQPGQANRNQYRPAGQQQRPAGNNNAPLAGQQRPVNNQQSQQRQRPPANYSKPNSQPGASATNQGQRTQRNDGNRSNQYGANRQRQSGGQDRKNQSRNRRPQNNQAAIQAKIEQSRPKLVKLAHESLTVKELSGKFGREVGEIIKKLMSLGVMATINQEVDMDTITILASEFGVTIEALPPAEDPTEIPEIVDSEDSLLPRPPVVTIMGHVDHGKTSLLDAIRQTNITTQEAGGITQHIGAYQVNYQNNQRIVFLDTPGHEAFTAMRARGAQVTDVAVLVVAADDGVMPQTIEAINHAKAAEVPIIVAMNKIDRPAANPDRIKQQLSEHGLVTEEWGGDTIIVPVSAKTKDGISELLEMILLVAEVQDLKANPNRLAIGTIVEAELDKGRGPVATVLVQKGTLHIGDTIIAGTAYGKVRAMINDRGEKVKKADPSTPVAVLGLSDVPMAGDILAVVDENTARAVAEKRISKKRVEEMGQMQKISLDDLFNQIQEGKLKNLNIVIKADVQGSIEALRQAFEGMKNKEVRVTLVHAGVGAINESDVMLASAANALIIGFNVRPDANSRKAADAEKIDIRTYRVIYDVINDVEAAMTGMLTPEYKELIQGRVEVRQVFSVNKTIVAGSYVLEGKVTNNSQLRIVRNGIVVHEGKIESLYRFKDEVKEVASGYECGISVEKYRDLKEGDILEAFTMEQIPIKG